MKTVRDKTISRLPASRFPEPAELYFCDNCGRDLTQDLYRDRAPVWQPLRPVWSACQCGRKYLSGAAEWDDLTVWERNQRMRQLRIGVVLFALLVIPVTLAYFALRYGGAALLAVVGIALIPSILVAKPFGFVLVDLYEIIASIWRTRVKGKSVPAFSTVYGWIRRCRPRRIQFSAIAAMIAVLIIATRWTPAHLIAASPMGKLTSQDRSDAGPEESLLEPARLTTSLTPQAAETGAPNPEFKRVQVGPNEVDYVSEDVTIRQFIPPAVRPRAQHVYREVHIGDDVTIRYFSPDAATAPRTRQVSMDRPFRLSK